MLSCVLKRADSQWITASTSDLLSCRTELKSAPWSSSNTLQYKKYSLLREPEVWRTKGTLSWFCFPEPAALICERDKRKWGTARIIKSLTQSALHKYFSPAALWLMLTHVSLCNLSFKIIWQSMSWNRHWRLLWEFSAKMIQMFRLFLPSSKSFRLTDPVLSVSLWPNASSTCRRWSENHRIISPRKLSNSGLLDLKSWEETWKHVLDNSCEVMAPSAQVYLCTDKCNTLYKHEAFSFSVTFLATGLSSLFRFLDFCFFFFMLDHTKLKPGRGRKPLCVYSRYVSQPVIPVEEQITHCCYWIQVEALEVVFFH